MTTYGKEISKRHTSAARAETRIKAEMTRGLGAAAAARTLRRRKANKDDHEEATELQQLIAFEEGASPSSRASEGPSRGLRSAEAHRLRGSRYSRGCSSTSLTLQIIPCVELLDAMPEDTLTIEVAASASLAEVKAKIAELYGIVVEAQKLQLTAARGDECFADTIPAAWASRLGPLHLLPVESSERQQIGEFQELQVLSEAQATVHAVVQSLHGVSYTIRVLRPKLVGGRAAGRSIELEVDALCLVGDLLAAVEAELFGHAVGTEPVVLRADGRDLPFDLPLHFAGVRDGDTVLLAIPAGHSLSDASDSEPDEFDKGMQDWAAQAAMCR